MELGIEEWAVITMKRGKRKTAEEKELANQESIKILGEKENYEYFYTQYWKWTPLNKRGLRKKLEKNT